MQKNTIKQKLLTECIRKQQSVIDDFNTRLQDLKESEYTAAEDELDGSRQGQKAQADSELNMLVTQLEFANSEKELLEKLQADIHAYTDVAEIGAMVVTDKITFFVSASIEQFSVDERAYVGLSIHSPLFQVMKGKREGDTFSFNKVTYTIKEIF
jgi:hypothetical protein